VNCYQRLSAIIGKSEIPGSKGSVVNKAEAHKIFNGFSNNLFKLGYYIISINKSKGEL